MNKKELTINRKHCILVALDKTIDVIMNENSPLVKEYTFENYKLFINFLYSDCLFEISDKFNKCDIAEFEDQYIYANEVPEIIKVIDKHLNKKENKKIAPYLLIFKEALLLTYKHDSYMVTCF